MFIWDLFKTIFGVYQPIQTISENIITTTTDIDGNTIVTETISYINSVDWSYIGSVVVFCILFYCALRILGGIICAK